MVISLEFHIELQYCTGISSENNSRTCISLQNQLEDARLVLFLVHFSSAEFLESKFALHELVLLPMVRRVTGSHPNNKRSTYAWAENQVDYKNQLRRMTYRLPFSLTFSFCITRKLVHSTLQWIVAQMQDLRFVSSISGFSLSCSKLRFQLLNRFISLKFKNLKKKMKNSQNS